MKPVFINGEGFSVADMRISRADISKAARLLGYRPRWSADEGLARPIGWCVTRCAARRAAQGTVPTRSRLAVEARAGAASRALRGNGSV